MVLEKLIEAGVLKAFKGGRIDDTTDTALPLVVSERAAQIEVVTSRPVKIVVWHEEQTPSSLLVKLAHGANLSLTEVYGSEKYASVTIEQEEGSVCRVVHLLMGGAHTSYEILLNGRHAEATLYGVMVASGRMHASTKVVTRHLVPDCKSHTAVKGVAMGRATAEFKGLVYVAQDAQRTDAEQINRNIELDGGRIYSEPQLEIYADDVKCSHGSTVGQLDEQSLYYMRQRGIPCDVAERMLLEGFVEDIVDKCDVEELKEFITFSFS